MTDSPVTADAPLLLTPRQAAALLAISERTLWGLAKVGAVPFVKIGVSKRFDRRDLVEFVDHRKRCGPIPPDRPADEQLKDIP